MTEAVTRPSPGAPCWVSLMAHDLETAERFYGDLFGWRFTPGPTPLGPYVRALQGDLPVAGLGQMASHLYGPVAWLPYFATDDAGATTALIRECGGTVAVGPLDADQAGRLGIAADTCGAVFGIWESGEHHGVEFSRTPGVPVWTEVVTRDASLISKFYTVVFDYTARSEPLLPETDFLTFCEGERPRAGAHGVGDDLPRDRGAHWLVYFSVADIAASARRVTELGGQVLGEPVRSPFGLLVRATDPEGARFALLQES